MDWLQSFRISWRAITSHRLRSFLTTLGVIIGVGAVITFVALGASLQTGIVGEIAEQQSPDMTVSAGPEGDEFGFAGGDQFLFTEYDIEQLQALEGVAAVIPQSPRPLAGVTVGGETRSIPMLTTTTPAFFERAGMDNFTSGGTFTPGEREVVLNVMAAERFDPALTSGDQLTLRWTDGTTVNVTVSGVVSPEEVQPGPTPGQAAIYGPVDPFHPVTATSPTVGEDQRTYPRLLVVASSFEELKEVQNRVEAYFAGMADATQLLPEDFEIHVFTLGALVEAIENVIETFTQFIAGIALIALVVGAIGIANIMLVSVTERTREIGIMKAVGAQRRDILQLFLVEAVVLGLVGAVAGTIVGLVTAYAVTSWIGLPFTFPIVWAGIAFVAGIMVGIIAGLYPAWNAAKTDPIDALRYE